MKIEFLIHEKYKAPQILICSNELTEEVKEVAELITQSVNETLTGYTAQGAELISSSAVVRIFAQDQKVFAQTRKETYALHARLYELEDRLSPQLFIRISNSEIVNIRKIKKLDTSITGTIKMHLHGGIETYVSRRNVSKIKKCLGL